MRTRNLVRASVVGFAALLLSASATPAERPTVGSPPLEQEVKVLANYWVQQIRTAGTAEEVTAAADGMIGEFERHKKHPEVQYKFSMHAAQPIIDLLANLPADELRIVREINTARAAAALNKLGIQRALNELVAHENPAVRYYGWVGYRGIRNQCLQSEVAPQRLYEQLQQRGQAETSGAVVGAMCRVMVLPTVRPSAVPDVTYYEAAGEFLAVLHDNWVAWAEHVPGEDITWADGLADGVGALTNLAAIAEQANLDQPTDEVLQDLIDAAAAGGYLYARAKTLAQQGQRPETDLANMENTAVGLLLACEAAMNKLAGEDKDYLQLPLSGKRPTGTGGLPEEIGDPIEQASAVQLGVINWVNELKGEHKVVQPRVQPPADSQAGPQAQREETEE